MEKEINGNCNSYLRTQYILIVYIRMCASKGKEIRCVYALKETERFFLCQHFQNAHQTMAK